uniref:Uncharacterized protein n=1 Tax=Arundo donax TaxID=35708 RepID=A0A0A9HTU5_ARUDO
MPTPATRSHSHQRVGSLHCEASKKGNDIRRCH